MAPETPAEHNQIQALCEQGKVQRHTATTQEWEGVGNPMSDASKDGRVL